MLRVDTQGIPKIVQRITRCPHTAEEWRVIFFDGTYIDIPSWLVVVETKELLKLEIRLEKIWSELRGLNKSWLEFPSVI